MLAKHSAFLATIGIILSAGAIGLSAFNYQKATQQPAATVPVAVVVSPSPVATESATPSATPKLSTPSAKMVK